MLDPRPELKYYSLLMELFNMSIRLKYDYESTSIGSGNMSFINLSTGKQIRLITQNFIY